MSAASSASASPGRISRCDSIRRRCRSLDWQNNTCVNVNPRGDDIAYLEGYRRGAELLVRHVEETERDQDFLIYPIVFLYRHHLELVFKRIIRKSSFLIDRGLTSSQNKALDGHKLKPLWSALKPSLVEICERARWKPLDEDTLNGIDDYIEQFARFDPDSQGRSLPCP